MTLWGLWWVFLLKTEMYEKVGFVLLGCLQCEPERSVKRGSGNKKKYSLRLCTHQTVHMKDYMALYSTYDISLSSCYTWFFLTFNFLCDARQ